MKYDLEERTAKFGEEVITFIKNVTTTLITSPLLSQLIRSATSIGANYCEADNASSKKDFLNKIAISKKEARETMHWLRMLMTATPNHINKLERLRQEAKELNLIFNAITRSAKTST